MTTPSSTPLSTSASTPRSIRISTPASTPRAARISTPASTPRAARISTPASTLRTLRSRIRSLAIGATLAGALTLTACADDVGSVDVVAADTVGTGVSTDPTTTDGRGEVATTSATTQLVPTTAAPSTTLITDRTDGTDVNSTPSTTTTSTATTSTTTSTSTTTLPVPVPTDIGPLDLTEPLVGLGFSVEGRPIIAERYGTPGGRPILVIGVIHGNEDDGVAIIDLLRTAEVPDGVELWLVESMNPDGQARQDRHNANEVDLNRNFPHNWGPIGEPGNSQYAGPAPASEPETQAMVNFISQLRPDIAMWYHQDANLVIPSTGRDGAIRARYAELTGLPLAQCCDGGGIYTGIAATWARKELEAQNAVAFIVELDGDLSSEEAATHAAAVLTVVAEN